MGLLGLPSRTVWEMVVVGDEAVVWARLISWAVAGVVVRLICGEETVEISNFLISLSIPKRHCGFTQSQL